MSFIEKGYIFETKRSGLAEVVTVHESGNVTVRFKDTDTEMVVTKYAVKTGNVKDRYAGTIYGKGYIGEGVYKTSTKCRQAMPYTCWRRMLSRCYNEKDESYAYYGDRGVTVQEEWLNYQNFASWFEKNYREGLQLDKDILSPGNREYGPTVCTFVPSRVNLLISQGKDRELPQGVCDSGYGGFIAQISRGGVLEYIGTYSTVEDAYGAYKYAKEKHVKEVAEEEYVNLIITKEVRDALLNWEVPAF